MRSWRALKGAISVLLSVSMVTTGLSLPSFASEEDVGDDITMEAEQEVEAVDISGVDLEDGLKDIVDGEEYPNGVISIGETMLTVNEGNDTVIMIVRGGSTEKEATVKFKAIDVSAVYGKDYTLSVKKDGGDNEVLPENPNAEPIMNENSYVDNGDTVSLNSSGSDSDYIAQAFGLSEEADEGAASEDEAASEDTEVVSAEEETVSEDYEGGRDEIDPDV